MQNEVGRSIWIAFGAWQFCLQGIFCLKTFITMLYNQIQSHSSCPATPGQITCKENCSCFLGQPAWTNVGCEGASESKPVEKLDHRSCASPRWPWRPLTRSEETWWGWEFHQAGVTMSTQRLTSAMTNELPVISQISIVFLYLGFYCII